MKPKVLKHYAAVWQQLHKLQNNLSFSQTTMIAAAKAILDKNQDEWNLSDKARLEQPKVISNRLRLACRHVCQALGKKTSPAWIDMIFGIKVPDERKQTEKKAEKVKEESENEEEENEEEQEEEEAEEEEEEEVKEEEEVEDRLNEKPRKKKPGKTVPGPSEAGKAKPGKTKLGKAKHGKQKPGKTKPGKPVTGTSEGLKETPGAWPFFGWDQELESAWRSKDGSAKVSRRTIEWSKEIKHPKDPRPHKFMLAMFGEDAYELSDMTVGDWALHQSAMVDKPRHTAAPAALWETEHKSSGLTVAIRKRADRLPLISLYHGTSQICQVPEKAFDDVPAAVAFLRVIGEKFASEVLPRNMILQVRNEMAKAQGIYLTARPKKRPSGAAVTGSPEAASGSATAAVTGSPEAALGSATAAVAVSPETACVSPKRKNKVSGSTKRKKARTNKPAGDKKVVKQKHAAAKVCKKPARASLQENSEEEVVDEDDDEEDAESEGGLSEPPQIGFVERDLLCRSL